MPTTSADDAESAVALQHIVKMKIFFNDNRNQQYNVSQFRKYKS